MGRQEEFKLESEGNVKWRELRIVSCWQVPVRQHDEESWNCRGTRSDLVRQHDEELEFGGKREVGIAKCMYLVQELVLQHYQIEFELEGNGNCISWRTSGGG